MKVDWPLVISVLTNIFALLVGVWKLSAWKSSLDVKIESNKADINRASNSIRREFRQADNIARIKIDTMSGFLEQHLGYRPPSMGNFEGDYDENNKD